MDKSYIPFCVFVLAVPVADAASGQNWLPTSIIALGTFLFAGWAETEDNAVPRWAGLLRIGTLVLLAASFLDRTHSCWQGRGSEYAVPALLMLLAMSAVDKGIDKAYRGVSVLRYGVYFVLGAVIILGLKEIQDLKLKPVAEYPSTELGIILLLPLLARKPIAEKKLWLMLLAIIASFVMTGKLYEYSRSIAIHGVAEHMESIMACAITIGYYALMVYLLDSSQMEAEAQKMNTRVIPKIVAVTAYAVYVILDRIPSVGLLGATAILWGIIPKICRKEKIKNWKKELDKRGNEW